ncbi:hypothetical protein ABIA54_004884 [Pseudomonas sp. EB276 TE3739]|uniref:hypothetical protein n=1 Tax=Pseudomonas TaxID=286 RepID=UPI0020A1928C|nr:hypothetical protein [Pseudomonas koreensis]MCP1476270.1 hypothetical protein [Pseudomonas koreensis]
MDDLPDDPLMPILLEAMKRLCTWDGSGPITWVIGDTWVVHHAIGEWTIGPDEPATSEQVRELMVQSGGVFELQDY